MSSASRLLFAAIAVALTMAAAAAHADKPTAKCVQNQLNDLGFDAGTVDGLIGPRTRAAADAWRKTQDPEPDLLRLTRRSAISWCRAIGKATPRLQKHWPARTPIQIFAADPGKTEPSIGFFRVADVKTRSFIRKTYNVDPVTRYVVVNATLNSSLRRQYEKAGRALNWPYRLRKDVFTAICPGARAVGPFIITCFPNFHDNPQNSHADQVYAESVLAHELFHIVQIELSQTHFPGPVPKGQDNLMGPNWLVEGTATVAGIDYAIPAHAPASWRHDYYRDSASTAEGALRNLRKHRSIRTQDNYMTAAYAAFLLQDRFGPGAILAYFENLPKVNWNWSKAFEMAFGMGLREFEDTYDTIRTDRAAALAFLNTAAD